MGDIADIRSDVAAAFEKADAAPESVAVEAPPAARAEPAAPAKETLSVETAQETSGRDEKGRFTSTKPAAETRSDPPAAAETPAGAALDPRAGAVPAASVPDLRAPQSWKPAARELVAKLPAEFRPIIEEAIRRERETDTTLNQSVEARRLSEAFNTVAAPYQAMLRRLGAQHPLQAVQNAFQTLDILHSGSPQQRADTIAAIIRESIGTDEAAITLLAGAIERKPGKASPQPAPAQPILTHADIEAISIRAADRRDVERSVRDFTSKAEFWPQVEALTVAIVQADKARGVAPDLKSAYERACNADPEISRIRQQREASSKAATGTEATQRAKAAASSVRSTPSGASNAAPVPENWREAVREALDKHEK